MGIAAHRAGALLAAIAVLAGAGGVVAASAGPAVAAALIQTIDVSRLQPPSPDPAGIAYLPDSDDLVIVDGEVEETPHYRGANMFRLDRRTRALIDTGTSTSPNPRPFSKEPVGAAFDPDSATLFIADDDDDQISLVRAGPDGRYGTGDDDVIEINVLALIGSTDLEGLAFDPRTGHLYMVDGLTAEVHELNPGADGTFATADDQTTHFDVQRYGARDPEGIAFDAEAGTILVLDKRSVVYVLDPTGALIGTIDCAAAGAREPAGLEVAPSTRYPGTQSLWIADRGVDNSVDSDQNDGVVFEMTLGAPPPAGPPVVQIVSPGDGDAHALTASIPFRATAHDARDGDLSSALAWTSDIDGAIGTGEFARVLSEGTHVVTAAATDSDAEVGRASITVVVTNQAPSIAIEAPVDGAWHASAREIMLGASASDAENGVLTPTWTSSLDGDLGTGDSLAVPLRDGVHTITASVTDTHGARATDAVRIEVGTPRTVRTAVGAGSDDAQQVITTGDVELDGAALDLGLQGPTPTLVGVRFAVDVPAGARVTRGYVQFRAADARSGPGALVIRGQAAADAAEFRARQNDIGRRTPTAASVSWIPPGWPTAGAAGAQQRTADLSTILNEVMSSPDWQAGNHVVLMIAGLGWRTAHSLEAGHGTPVLHIEHR